MENPAVGIDQTVYVFLDANTLIHFQTFDEVDWHTVIGAQRVVLVFEDTVLGELDKFKDDRTNLGRRDRIRQLQAVLKKYISSGKLTQPVSIRANVDAIASVNSPRVDWAELGLDPQVADDRVIASMILFQESHADSTLIYVSNDYRPRLKVEGHGFQAVDPEGFVTRVELASDQEKQLKSLRDENAALKRRIPRLSLLVEFDGQRGLVVTVPRPEGRDEDLTHDALDNEINRRRDEYKRAVWFAGQHPDYVRKFFYQLENYLDDLRIYLRQKWILESSWLVELSFVIGNDGSAPARNLEVEIEAENVNSVYESSDLPDWLSRRKAIKEPTPPRVPRQPSREDLTAFAATELSRQLQANTFIPGLYPPSFPTASYSAPSAESWTKGGIVFAEVPNLKAKRQWSTDSYLFAFHPIPGRAVNINYVIHADELNEELIGKLTLRFETLG